MILKTSRGGTVELNDSVLEYGDKALNYLTKRSRENPYFAYLSAAFHAGPINYTTQQRHVEKMLRDAKPDEIRSVEDVRPFTRDVYFPGAKATRKRGMKIKTSTVTAQDVNMTERRVVGATECFLENRPDHPINDASACIVRKKGFGKKIVEMFKEYLGDPDAVAVDRHIMSFVCDNPDLRKEFLGVWYMDKDKKLYKRPGKGRRKLSPRQCTYPNFPDNNFWIAHHVVSELARKNDITPSRLQVAVWLNNACSSKIIHAGGADLFLGKGMTINCFDATGKTYSDFYPEIKAYKDKMIEEGRRRRLEKIQAERSALIEKGQKRLF